MELIRPIKLRCFVFPFYQIFGITWAFTSSEESFLSQKSQLPLKHTPSNSFLFILLLYCHTYYSYNNGFRALNSDPLQVKNWPHLQRFDYSGFPFKAMNEIRPFIYVPLPRQARFWHPLSLQGIARDPTHWRLSAFRWSFDLHRSHHLKYLALGPT